MLACYRNNIDIINILLKHNADISKEDNKGFSPICYAFASAISKRLKPPFSIVDMLLQKLNEDGNLSIKCYILVSLYLTSIHIKFYIYKGLAKFTECKHYFF